MGACLSCNQRATPTGALRRQLSSAGGCAGPAAKLGYRPDGIQLEMSATHKAAPACRLPFEQMRTMLVSTCLAFQRVYQKWCKSVCRVLRLLQEQLAIKKADLEVKRKSQVVVDQAADLAAAAAKREE